MPASVEASVIIPCHNHASFLREAVESVIRQEGVHLEVMVVDDGSTEDLMPALRDLDFPRIRLIRQNHTGAGFARNAGVTEAEGSYLAFLDADDWWASDRVIRALETLKSAPSATMAFATMQEFLDPDLELSEGSSPHVRTLPGVSASCLVVGRADFHRVGPFDPSLKTGEFIDWYLRADRLGLRTHVDEKVLVYRRIHEANRDRWRRSGNRDYARILMRNLKNGRGRS